MQTNITITESQNKDYRLKLGDKNRQVREQKGYSQEQLADIMDINRSTISKIENGKRNVPEEILPKLSSYFNLDLKKLEHEYLSEKIAELIYPQEETKSLLKAAEEKAKYIRTIKTQQGTIKF